MCKPSVPHPGVEQGLVRIRYLAAATAAQETGMSVFADVVDGQSGTMYAIVPPPPCAVAALELEESNWNVVMFVAAGIAPSRHSFICVQKICHFYVYVPLPRHTPGYAIDHLLR